jgi:hypothetical protein
MEVENSLALWISAVQLEDRFGIAPSLSAQAHMIGVDPRTLARWLNQTECLDLRNMLIILGNAFKVADVNQIIEFTPDKQHVINKLPELLHERRRGIRPATFAREIGVHHHIIVKWLHHQEHGQCYAVMCKFAQFFKFDSIGNLYKFNHF